MVRRHRSAVVATSSSGAFTNTPTSSSRRCSSDPIASASSIAQTRGLSGQKIIPSAQAPRSATRRASAGSVTPHILTRVVTRPRLRAEGHALEIKRWALREREGRPVLFLELPAAELLWPLAQLHADGSLVVAAVDLELRRVAGLHAGNGGHHVVGGPDRLAVDRHDHVAGPGEVARQLIDLRAAQARLLRGRALLHALDERSGFHGEIRLLREVLLHGVDRHREPDAHRALAATGGDLRVDADHSALRVEQRAP